ncbi:TnsA-like heteromeric transposase endonuclease subunit [Paenarthrobacter nicotinovorans]|uniref:TnsA-like heteromeric transposase endonuclease subunit n=1 Tax=Paenarthrobacter nicotinovorans TaxID=29320 RepID=UPI003D6679DA
MFASAALAMNDTSRTDRLDRSCVFTVREHPGASLSSQGVAGASELKFEDFAPVRATTAYKGQRNFSGEWWCSTNGRMVAYESWLERDHLMCMDRAPKITGITSQPFKIDFKLRAGPRWHVPDFFARLKDGSALVVDVRPENRIKDRDREVFDATDSLCRGLGWRYKRVGGLPRVYLANLRWLSGYRHPRCLVQDISVAIIGSLSGTPGSRALGHVAAAVGDPVATYPTLYHLLWSGIISADLRRAPLGPDSILWIAGQ